MRRHFDASVAAAVASKIFDAGNQNAPTPARPCRKALAPKIIALAPS